MRDDDRFTNAIEAVGEDHHIGGFRRGTGAASAKRDPDTYVRLAIGMNVPPLAVAFLSDVEAELDAATTAGMRACHIVRPGVGIAPSQRHPVATDFAAAARVLDLPKA